MPVRRTKNDTRRKRWQLRQRGGVIDLTAASQVRMFAKLAPGQSATGTTTLSGVCTVEDAPQGIVREPVGSTGALAEALYLAQFQIDWSDGTSETVPDGDGELLEIRPDLGP